MSIPFTHQYDLEYGVLQQVSPGIRRITAKNPSVFTFHGTGTYVVGRGRVAVIDPGPAIPEHIDALLSGLGHEEITHILVTHTHLDHSPGTRLLQQHTNAKSHGFGPHGAGKIAEGIKIEEGGDMDFVPDIRVRHGDLIEGDGFHLEVVYTPGHTSNHLCFQYREEKALFSGDHVMGWSTSVIGPPDGDMSQYMDSLELLLGRDDEIYWPTHGTCIKDPKPYVRAFIEHRLAREAQILDCLRQGVSRIRDMVPLMYQDTDKSLYPAAAQSVFAAMTRLLDQGRVLGDLHLDSEYRLPSAAPLRLPPNLST